MKPLETISLDELSRVSGGFLPLLGLIGAGASLAGQITGAIGQKKAKEAEALMAQNQAAGGAPPSDPGGAAAPAMAAASAPGPRITTNVSIS